MAIRRALTSLLLLGTALVALSACDRAALPGEAGGKPSFKAIDITGAEYAQGLELNDPDGRRRTLAEFKGKVVVVFFGFTQCPDVCPTTLVELAGVKQQLGADGERVQGVFVTVDPERDTPALLKAYVENFDKGFLALRGTPDDTRVIAKQFKVFYNKVPGKTDTSYTVDHTAGSYIFDATGKVRLFTRYGSGAEALLHDLKILLNEKPA
jgi:protein SCO1/2